MSYWTGYAERCLIAADRVEEATSNCFDTAAHFVLGTYVHLLLSAGRDCTPENTTLLDEQCGDVNTTLLTEAFRIYKGYWDVIGDADEFKDGEVLGRELLIAGEPLEKFIGFAPIAATLDVLVKKSDGEYWIYDYKTSGKTGNYYQAGSSKLQRWLYCLAAESQGYPISRFVNRQIVKTKVIQTHDYLFLPPSPLEKRVLLNYLQGAQERKYKGIRNPYLTQCESCRFQADCQFTA